MRFLRLDVNRVTPGIQGTRGITSRIGLACLLVASIFCAGALAQSGRRVRAGEKPGTPQSAPIIVPETAEPAKPKRVLPKVMLIVGGRIDNKSERADAIFNAFVIRLGQSMQTNSLGLVKHEEAEKRARAETENYVVWLEIDRDNYEQGRVIFNSLNYTVKYSVLAPRTAEVKAKGRVYYQGNGGARTRTDQSSVVKNTPEDAGETAADMVLDWLAVLAAQAK